MSLPPPKMKYKSIRRRSRHGGRKSWSTKSVPRYSGFEVGDLVTVVEHCKDSGRLAILTEIPSHITLAANACKIQWIDEEGLKQGPIAALLSNISKIE